MSKQNFYVAFIGGEKESALMDNSVSLDSLGVHNDMCEEEKKTSTFQRQHSTETPPQPPTTCHQPTSLDPCQEKKSNSRLLEVGFGVLCLLLVAGMITTGVHFSAKLSASGDKMEALLAQLSAMEMRLNVTDSQMEEVKRDNAALQNDVSDLKTENSALQIDMSALKTQNSVLQNDVSALKTQNSALQNDVTDLKTENSALLAQLNTLEMRLNTTESEMEEVKRHNAVFVKVNGTEMGEVVLAHLYTLEMRLNATERHNAALQNDVAALKTENSERKVAFSAGLTSSGTVGPFVNETTLIFKEIVTNIGQAYDNATGVFTAPVRGLYYFRFTANEHRVHQIMGVRLYHNGKSILLNLVGTDGAGDYISNALAVELQEGDVVEMKLPATFVVFDIGHKFTTFTGFLLFTM